MEQKIEPLVMMDATVGEVMVQLINRNLGTDITDWYALLISIGIACIQGIRKD
jgi:tetrahydromethanopterin S-methyltransferase subunit G